MNRQGTVIWIIFVLKEFYQLTFVQKTFHGSLDLRLLAVPLLEEELPLGVQAYVVEVLGLEHQLVERLIDRVNRLDLHPEDPGHKILFESNTV